MLKITQNLSENKSPVLLGGQICKSVKKLYICSPDGALAEWLGAGLQNLSQWFDSATHLKNASDVCPGHFYVFPRNTVLMPAERAHSLACRSVAFGVGPGSVIL